MARFDLAGNPLPDDSSPQPPPYAGPQSPGSPHVGISAEQLVGSRPSDGLAERILENSSGSLDDVPPEVEKLHWNWGAFLVPSFWAFNHGMRPLALAIWGLGLVLHFMAQIPTQLNTTLGVVYTVFCFGVSLWLGFCGNKIAWRIRRFEGGLDEYFAVQKAWLIAGVAVAVVSVIAGGKLTPGIALYNWKNVTRPVNADKTDYEFFYGSTPTSNVKTQ